MTSSKAAATDRNERPLVIDLTPTCLNRTAIYHIALETAEALAARTAGLQFCGEIMERPASREAELALRARFFSDLGTWSAGSTHADEIEDLGHLDEADEYRRLYFDPLYTIYRPLTSRDTVFVLDLTTVTNPEWHNPVVARAYDRVFRKLVSSPARIVSISENCTAALRANYAVPSKDITTVPLYLREVGFGAERTPIARLVGHRFLLFVGSLEVRKNITGLVEAFALSGLAEDGWLLAIAGGDGEGAASIRAIAETIQGVEILGFVSDAELAWLYEMGSAFIYPSFLEGFGLPLVEAMAHGMPCLASLTGASSEICGDLGVLVDPYDMESMVAGILECAQAATGISERERKSLRERAGAYSFDRYMASLIPALD